MSLPSTYKQVEYIESSSTGPFINTGITPNQNTISKIKVMPLEVTGGCIYGAYYQSMPDTSDYRLFNYNSQFYFDVPGGSGSGNRISGGSFPINTVKEIEIGNFYVKDIPTGTNIISGTTQSSFTGSTTIKLNGTDSTQQQGCSHNRWYYVKIYNGSTLQRDLIPCYRKSDNVVGMYDLVNNVFYTNAGTGTFTKGPDVIPRPAGEHEMVNAYIGEYHEGWTPGSSTIAYYPFTNDQTDQTGNTSIPATGSKQTIGYRFTLSGQSYIQLSGLPRAPYFISYWMKINSFGNQGSINSIWNTIFGIQYYRSHYNGTWGNKVVIRCSSDILVNGPSDPSQWNHVCYGGDGTNYIIGINGTITTKTGGPASKTPLVNLLDGYTGGWSVDFSDLIIEDSGGIWDSSEIQAYYNQTKSKYGL